MCQFGDAISPTNILVIWKGVLSEEDALAIRHDSKDADATAGQIHGYKMIIGLLHSLLS